MKSFPFALAAAIACSTANAAEPPSASCPLTRLLASIESRSQAVRPPALPKDVGDSYRTISLYEPPGATDELLYAAVVDSTSQRAWVYQYGGFAGVSNWYGPFNIDPSLSEPCPPARAVIPVAVASNSTAGAQPILPPDPSQQTAPAR